MRIVLAVTVGVLLILLTTSCPPAATAPTGKDPRLIGAWVGETCTVWSSECRDVVITFNQRQVIFESTEGMETGNYYCDTSVTPMRIDCYLPYGRIPGLYIFGSDSPTLIFGYNDPYGDPRPASLEDAEALFTGTKAETHILVEDAQDLGMTLE
jgi:hypothetical protein